MKQHERHVTKRDREILEFVSRTSRKRLDLETGCFFLALGFFLFRVISILAQETAIALM